MTAKPKKPDIFTEAYWKRPDPQEMGDPTHEVIYAAVGRALDSWERSDQQMANLFMTFVGASRAALRAYGAIESNSGRRKAVEAAAEVYLSDYWHHKPVGQAVTDIINAVTWASKRRDDIAHGIAMGIVFENKDYGVFHLPPEYNTGRTYPALADTFQHPTDLLRPRYRYTSNDIRGIAKKFDELETAIWQFAMSAHRKDGKIPFIEEMIADGRISTSS